MKDCLYLTYPSFLHAPSKRRKRVANCYSTYSDKSFCTPEAHLGPCLLCMIKLFTKKAIGTTKSNASDQFPFI